MAALLVRRSSSSTSNFSRFLFGFNSPPHHYYYYYKSNNNLIHMLYCSTTTNKPPSTTIPLFSEDYFIAKYKFSPQIASKLVSASATMRNPQNPDILLSCLKECGFSNAHLERVVRHYSAVLTTSPERSVKPKLKTFRDLGFSAADATEIIATHPNILHYEPKRIIHSINVYKRLLGSTDHVIRLVKKCSSLLYTDPEKTVLPNIQFLNTCGVQIDQINSFMPTVPHFFTISLEHMRRCVDKVDEMGVKRTSKMFIYAAWAVCTMSDETLKLKLKCFQDMGFTEDDILRLFRSYPMVISVSTWKIKEVKEVLLETGKYDMSCIIKNPISLMRSVEKRFKPRLEVMKALERKGLISKWPSLSVLGGITDEMFYEKFVAPNIKVLGQEFIAKTALIGKLGMAQLPVD